MKSWYAKNPNISFFDLLFALEQHESISTEYGLNVSIEQHWRLGDPHKKTAAPDRHDYEIAMVGGRETLPGPDWHKFYRWLVSQSRAFLPYHTVYLVTDNRDLQSDKVKSEPGLSHWPMVAAWWKERLRYVGPYGELTTVVFVHISADTGLHKVHPTWAGTYILDACVFLFPAINFALIDSDCVPVTLFEIRELWLASTDPTHSAASSTVAKSKLSSPIASSHKRARSVDTGRDMQQPGPPSKLSRSHSADHLAGRKADPLRAPPFTYGANLADEVDYGDSPDPSPRMSRRVTSSSDDSSPAGSTKPTRKDKVAEDETATAPRPKGVILVSEAFTEINAGLVIVLASGHESPVPVTVLDDSDTDPDEIARVVTSAYHRHVEAYLATTYPPADVEQAVASGLLGSPLLGTSTRVTADWCHAWSLLGQWSGLVTFPVPASGVWPRHGHLRKILDGYQGRQPNFHKWARPAYEQGALPTLSLLPGEVSVRVLPGDKMYQAMAIETHYMRPVILHGFGTSAKKRMPSSLADLAQFGWLPLAAALFGTHEWKPQWLHHNFLPVVGLRLHAKVPPPPLSQAQLILLCGLWQRKEQSEPSCTSLQQAAHLKFGLPLPFREMAKWEITVNEQTIDVGELSKQNYIGRQPEAAMPAALKGSVDWASWVFSLVEVWQDDAPMQDRPLEVHCSGLGGGLLSGEHEYDIFLQNLAQTKVYGPSLAMTDNWEEHITQLGLTKTVHEYAVYQLLSTADGWTAWRDFLPEQFSDPQLLLTRAIRLIEAANIRPAHARPPHPTWSTAIMQIFRCYHPQGKQLFLKSCFPHLVTTADNRGGRDINVYGFSAGSYTGLAVHEILSEFAAFPGLTKVAAIATPPEMLRLATGERRVTLVHCLEDRLCVWRPASLTEFNYQVVLIEGHPTWSGRAKHSYGHLLFIDIDEGVHEIQRLQITTPQVIPHGVRCEGLLRVLSWVSFDLPEHLKTTLSALLVAAGEGNTELQNIPIGGRDIRDGQPDTEADLQAVLIAMIPTPGGSHDEGGFDIQDRQLVVIPGIHYFDAHRLQPDLLATLDRQFDPGSMKFASPEGAGDTVNDPSSDEEAASTDAESDPEDPTVAWCPPIPDAAEDPSEDEIVSAADQLAILITNVQPNGNPFCIPENLGILPPLWLQARLTLSLTAIQEKFARILLSVACELWLRGQSASVEDVLLQTARALTIRLAEKLAQAMSTLMRSAESMVTPETECLLYATYWFRPILSELIGSARESSEMNRSRAPSGPVKVLVTDRPHRRTTGLVDLTSGASALLAWFPASWASKIAPKLLENAPENAQKPQEINIACPKRSCDEAPVEGAKQLLQAVKFAAKTMPGFRLGLDEDFQMAGCFQELIHGYTSRLVEPYMMRGLQPLGPTRTTLEVIIPSQEGLTPEKWKETATLCPLDWPSNYSLLRLWHTNGSLHQTVARLRKQLSHSHMFAEWTVHLNRFAERVLFQQPAVYVAGHALQANLRERTFPDRKGRRRVPPDDLDEHQRAIRALHQRAIAQQAANPVSFALTNEWNDTITSDKKHHLEHFMRGTT